MPSHWKTPALALGLAVFFVTTHAQLDDAVEEVRKRPSNELPQMKRYRLIVLCVCVCLFFF
jgi:hypothetical protein